MGESWTLQASPALFPPLQHLISSVCCAQELHVAWCVCPTGGRASHWLWPVSFFWKLFWQREVLKAWVRIAGELPGALQWAGRTIRHKQKVWGRYGRRGAFPAAASLVFFKPVLSEVAGAVSFCRRRGRRWPRHTSHQKTQVCALMKCFWGEKWQYQKQCVVCPINMFTCRTHCQKILLTLRFFSAYNVHRCVSSDKDINDKMLRERGRGDGEGGGGPLMQRKYVPCGSAVPSLSITGSVKCSSVAAGVESYCREGTKWDGYQCNSIWQFLWPYPKESGKGGERERCCLWHTQMLTGRERGIHFLLARTNANVVIYVTSQSLATCCLDKHS